MTIDNRLPAANDILELIELNKLLADKQRQIVALQCENELLKRVNTGFKNRLQLLLRSVAASIQARKQAI
jgi:FtsZ-binding cell division protein ZapB